MIVKEAATTSVYQEVAAASFINHIYSIQLFADLLWSGILHFVAGQRELFEILFEALSEILYLLIIRFFVFPGVSGIEHFGWHVGTGSGEMQSKYGIRHHLHFVHFAADSSPYHSSRVVDV